jgi:hypothetical protein
MSEWTPDEVRAIGEIEEVSVAPLAGDGTPLQAVTMWAVTNGSEVFVRSVRGKKGRWFRRVTETGRAVFDAGDISREVTFAQVNEVKNQTVTDAYNAKYAQYGPERQAMVEGDSVEATLQVVPV